MPPRVTNQAIAIGASIAMLLASLPLEWVTIHNAKFNFGGGPGEQMGFNLPMPAGFSIAATGLNGTLSLGPLKAPMWLLAGAAAGLLLIGLLNALRLAAVPKAAVLVPLGLIGLVLLVGLAGVLSGDGSLGAGYLLALAGIAVGAISVLSSPGGPDSETSRLTD
ncbi:hypothetical protein Pla175_16370 [Pirellulimonas nuda]|uniref:Uncharacterized protein n=1 Tax=Pirellulimonas nuda TaxID=2528009 RepID=A0A518D9Z1_9BACT|nr:hypothetical protein [Pirellulimonas nuda]QDU88263.1 hypothetical protein Pla175_16370 [Pirellulimonas nuda]